jgi:hypothetical protein
MKWKFVEAAFVVCWLAVMMSAQPAHRDFLLLDNGDKILVDFPAGAHGSIQVKSLSARARVDIENTRKRGYDMMVLTDKDGWKTYRGKVDGASIAITLREVQGNKKKLATPELPADSDAVVRIINSEPPRIAGGDNSKRGSKCPVCGRVLNW